MQTVVRSGICATVPSLAPYYLYQAAASTSFFQPIFMVFYQERAGLSLATVLGVQTYFMALRAILDVPFGVVADRTSRRACLVAGMLASAAGMCLVVARPTLVAVVVAETLFAIGMALRSGADSALLYDALKATGGLARYPQAESRSQAVVALASGLSAIVGSTLATYDLTWPWVAGIVAAFLAALAAGWIAEAPAHGRHDASRLRAAARVAARTPAVRWTLGLAALVVSASHVFYYLQQPYMTAAGVPIALFGVVFAATKLVTALVAGGAHRVEERLGPAGTTAAMTVVPVLGLGAMAAVHGPLGAVVIVSRGFLDGLWMPLVNVLMNRLVPSEHRATMLSLQSLVSRLTLAGVIALLGVAAQRLGLAATLGGSACLVAVIGIALCATAPRLPEPPRVIAE